ncbi:MAG: hypothetical protein DI630_00470 [Gordonia sp. (in: high G+C Gram-positive bacteria)]|nr:MAG: hypothetical protein DI630_00470 [Gordonia sp. (in: high G+C Gram-positive bacteria)]
MFSLRRRRARRPSPYIPVSPEAASSTVSDSEHTRCRTIVFDAPAPDPFVAPDDTEHELWRSGKLVPWYITRELNRGGHNGPQVDIACGASEPDVDNWELGHLYPTWDQTVALAQLVNVRVRNLTHPDAHPCHHPERPVHRPARDVAILSFEPAAVQAATA